MKQRIITGIIFTLAIAVFIVPGYWTIWPPIAMFVAAALICAHELSQVLRARGMKPASGVIKAGSLMVLLPLIGASCFFPNQQIEASDLGSQVAAGFSLMTFALLVISFFIVILMLIRRGPNGLPDAVATVSAIIYVVFPLGCAVLLISRVGGGFLWLLVGLTSPWITDSFAYFTGFLIGRRPIIPQLSPKKTLEGSIGGVIGCMLVIPLVFYLFGHTLGVHAHPDWMMLLFAMLSGLILSIASQFGDWFASAIKRWCTVKDFGKLLPGHGGLLDRFDSAFFTLPIGLLLAFLYQLLFVL